MAAISNVSLQKILLKVCSDKRLKSLQTWCAGTGLLLLLTGQMLEVFDITTTAPPQWGYKVQQHHRLYRPVTVTLLFPIRPELKGPWQGEINWLDIDMNISQWWDWPHDMSCSNRSEWGQSTLSVEISQWGWALTSPQSSSERCGPVRDGRRQEWWKIQFSINSWIYPCNKKKIWFSCLNKRDPHLKNLFSNFTARSCWQLENLLLSIPKWSPKLSFGWCPGANMNIHVGNVTCYFLILKYYSLLPSYLSDLVTSAPQGPAMCQLTLSAHYLPNIADLHQSIVTDVNLLYVMCYTEITSVFNVWVMFNIIKY